MDLRSRRRYRLARARSADAGALDVAQRHAADALGSLASNASSCSCTSPCSSPTVSELPCCLAGVGAAVGAGDAADGDAADGDAARFLGAAVGDAAAPEEEDPDELLPNERPD